MFLYHRVPRTMAGTTLYPLNTLKELHPRLYEEYLQKYADRRGLMKRNVPQLNCLWNDVLFTMALAPAELYKAYKSFNFPGRYPPRFYKIPLERLDQHQIVVLTKMGAGGTVYEDFSARRMQAYATLPQETLLYWEERKKANDERPLLFMHIPHVMYKGTINIEGLEIVSVKTPE